MKTPMTFVMAITSILACMTACDSTSTSKKGEKVKQIDLALNGIWDGRCQKQDLLNFTQIQDHYTFSALGDFDKTTEVFQSNCQTADLVMELSGTYDSLGAVAGEAKTKNVNFTVSAASITPKSPGAVTILNAKKYCSTSDWAVDKKSDILDKNCAGLNYKKGEVIADIYKLDGNSLFFGRKVLSLISEAPGNRPTKINESDIFVKR